MLVASDGVALRAMHAIADARKNPFISSPFRSARRAVSKDGLPPRRTSRQTTGPYFRGFSAGAASGPAMLMMQRSGRMYFRAASAACAVVTCRTSSG